MMVIKGEIGGRLTKQFVTLASSILCAECESASSCNQSFGTATPIIGQQLGQQVEMHRRGNVIARRCRRTCVGRHWNLGRRDMHGEPRADLFAEDRQ